MMERFDQLAIEKFASDSKVGLIATTDDEGYPHVMFINTLQTKGDDKLTWGKFIEGKGKELITKNKKVAFLVLNTDMELWRGKADYTHSEAAGEDFEAYANKPLFRYNSYFSVGSVHYMDLKCVTDIERLKKAEIALGAVKSRSVAGMAKSREEAMIMNSLTMAMFEELDGLKFIAYTDTDGYPWLVPAIQMTTAGHDRLVFSLSPYGEELSKIPEGAQIAVFFASLKLQTVMVKGQFTGVHKYALGQAGVISVEKVYNPMPPKSGYIYPATGVAKVTEF